MNLDKMVLCLNAINEGMKWCVAEEQFRIISNSGYCHELVKIDSDRLIIKRKEELKQMHIDYDCKYAEL